MGEPRDFKAIRAAQLRKEGKGDLAGRLEQPNTPEHYAPDPGIDADRELVAGYFTENEQALLDAVQGDVGAADTAIIDRFTPRQRREYIQSIGEEERDIYLSLLKRNAVINTTIQSLRKTGYRPSMETLQTRRDIVRNMTNVQLYELIMECPEDEIERRVQQRPAFYEALIRMSQERGEEEIAHFAYMHLHP